MKFTVDLPVISSAHVVTHQLLQPADQLGILESLASAMQITEIPNNTVADEARALGKKLGLAATSLEKTRKTLQSPYQQAASAIMDAAKSVIAQIDMCRERLRTQLTHYDARIALAKQEAEAAQAEAEIFAARDDVTGRPTAPLVVDDVIIPTSSVPTRTDYTYEITDFNAVPREFLAVDLTKVREHFKTSSQDIPGIKRTAVQKATFR